MRFLHTSDWHLGKRLGSFARHHEQVAVMNELCDLAETEQIDFVVVAGDIFDTFNPPIEAIELYYETIRRLANNGNRPVIVIAGNHDSPDRIESSDPLARQLGIIQCGSATAALNHPAFGDLFKIEEIFNGGFVIKFDNGKRIKIIHSAFSNEQRLGTSADTSVNENLADIWDKCIKATDADYTILLSHALVSGSLTDECDEPEGEKPIEHISERILASSIPEGIDYTALGHLHRYQFIDGAKCPIVYSGSPLAYSFSEANQSKFAVLVDIETNDIVAQKLTSGKPLRRKIFTSVDDACLWLTDQKECWVEVVIRTQQFLSPKEIKRMREIHHGIVNIIPELLNAENSETKTTVDLTKSRSELFVEYFKFKKQQAPSDELLAIFNTIVSEETTVNN